MINKKGKKMKILVINGPNINMLGKREPEIYGTTTLLEIEKEIKEYSTKFNNVSVDFFQSNHEGEIVEKIQNSINVFDGILINPAAYTHTSVAIADAIKAVNLPAVEIHLSNIQSREEFRKHSITASACIGQIAGFGKDSYIAGLYCLIKYIERGHIERK